jgi:hypothetical protein
MSEHTKEPWRAENFAIRDEQGRMVLQIGVSADRCFSTAEMEANAVRIAACVNACAGIPTSMLESAGQHAVMAIPPAAAISTAIADVLAERRRQIQVEGWTAEHDDEHDEGDMALAGACYAASAAATDDRVNCRSILDSVRSMWPWGREWWKPKNQRRDLVRAAALVIAEIEKMDRAEVARLKAQEAGRRGLPPEFLDHVEINDGGIQSGTNHTTSGAMRQP